MSKRETPLTRRFWQQTGGTLTEEFLAVPLAADHGKRLIDGVIIPGGPHEIQSWQSADLKGKDIIVIQTKASRLGMYILGQGILSARLMQRFEPASIRSVVICNKGDSILEPIAKDFGIDVVIYPEYQ